MTKIRDRAIWTTPEDEQAAADRQTASLAGLAFALFLVVIGLFLVHTLHQQSMVQDCLLAGRHNCDILVSDLR